MAKKKKMTRAQAAAARRDDKPKRKTVTHTTSKDSAPKNKDTMLFQILIPLISIAVIVVLSLVFTIGPGFVIGN